MPKRENMLEMVASIDAKRRKKTITQTQSSLNYNLGAELTAPGIPRESCGMTYEERIRVSASPVGFREVAIGDNDTPIRQSPARTMSAGLSTMQWDGTMIDDRQLSANDISETKIVSIIDQADAEHDEAVAEDLETKLRTAGSPSSEDRPKVNGLWGHFRGTHNSGGTVVEQVTPAFNGIYGILSDASVSATYQGLSRVTYPRLTNLNATYNDGLDTMDIVRLLKRMSNKTNFVPSRIMRFKETLGDCVIFCPHDFYLRYSEIVNVKNADKNAALDTEPQDATHIGRARLVVCPSLDSDSLVPFFGVRLSQMKWLYDPKWWMKRGGPFPIANQRHGMYFGWDWVAQLWCKNPRNAGFVLHRATAVS